MRGVVAFAGVLLVAGCSSEAVEIDSPDLSSADRAACAALVEALPDTLFGELRRSVTPDDAPGAAWGVGTSEPVTLTCGVDRPDDYTQFSECLDIDRVGWFISESDREDLGAPATVTALTVSPRVELVVPARLRGKGVDSALAELAGPVRQTLESTSPCH